MSTFNIPSAKVNLVFFKSNNLQINETILVHTHLKSSKL